MSGGIYLMQDNGELTEMNEKLYDSEAVLQELLAKYPNLLAGDQMDSQEPRRWLLVKREMGLPSDDIEGNRWSVDHLFLDQDGIPTLVEVKRSTNSEIHRTIVGQLLEYGAHAVLYWPVERIVAELERRCEQEHIDLESALSDVLSPDSDSNQYWDRVRTNLQAGHIRLVFVADVIPSELRRIVEFLNEQMHPADVFALEVKQFVGGGLKTLVPRLIGASEKKRGTGPRAKKKWNESDFLAALHETSDPQAETATRNLLRSLYKMEDVEVWWGEGPKSGSFVPRIFHKGVKHQLFAARTAGKIDFYFDVYMKKQPFESESMRQELLDRLVAVSGLQLSQEKTTGYPNASIVPLADAESLNQFTDVIHWMIEEIRKT